MPSVHVIGYGSVAQAFEVRLREAKSNGELGPIDKVYFHAPEIQNSSTHGLFSWQHCDKIVRETLVGVVEGFSTQPGDLIIEVGTRIDTATIWKEARKRECHFINTAMDCWEDLELELSFIPEFRNREDYHEGKGITNVFGFGMNPGVVNHFVAHGLRHATGVNDVQEAADKFGLRSIIFAERDTQWPRAGSAAEKQVLEDQEHVLHCTWSPGNYLVETGESNLQWPGMPPEAATILSSTPTLLSWVPSGPIVGFAPQHDETFTVQRWFRRDVPAMFVYESPPPARRFLKGPCRDHSSVVKQKLMCPATLELQDEGYDMIGAVLLSDQEGQEPLWCGLNMTVGDAARWDDSRMSGPTPLQVAAGVWCAMQFVLQHPNVGDCFPEDIPTEFVIANVFPFAGRLLVRPCPEALQVPGFFDPAAPDALQQIHAACVEANRVVKAASAIHGQGVFAAGALAAGTMVAELGPGFTQSFAYNHSCCPNAYVDRNYAVRTLCAVEEGQEITVEYALLVPWASAEASSMPVTVCSCGDASCRGSVGDWKSLPESTLLRYLRTLPMIREMEEEVLSKCPQLVTSF